MWKGRYGYLSDRPRFGGHQNWMVSLQSHKGCLFEVWKLWSVEGRELWRVGDRFGGHQALDGE